MTDPRTLFDKIWNRHVVADLGGGYALLHVSRAVSSGRDLAEVMHEVSDD